MSDFKACSSKENNSDDETDIEELIKKTTTTGQYIKDYIVCVQDCEDKSRDYLDFKFISDEYLVYEIRIHWMGIKNGLEQFSKLPAFIRKIKGVLEVDGYANASLYLHDIKIRISGDRVVFSNQSSQMTFIYFKLNASLIDAFKELYNWFVDHRIAYEKSKPSKSLVLNEDEGFYSSKYFGPCLKVVEHEKMVLPQDYEPKYDDIEYDESLVTYEDGFEDYTVEVEIKPSYAEDNCIFKFIFEEMRIVEFQFYWMDMKDSLKIFGDLPNFIKNIEYVVLTGKNSFCREKYINDFELRISGDTFSITELKTHYTTFYFKINESLLIAFKKLYNWYMRYRKEYEDSKPSVSRDSSTLPVTYKTIPKIDLPPPLRGVYKLR